jgi:anthrone oxygenase-like protein
MFLVLQVVTLLLVSVAMSLALAHTLELPGKMRLDRETYLAVQSVYYPGFTVGGIAEPLAIAATIALLLTTPTSRGAFWLTLAALVALVTMHAFYWVLTHPVNTFWLKDQPLGRLGGRLFSLGARKRVEGAEEISNHWESLRDQWEYSHVLRAGLAAIAMIALSIAVAA